MPYQDGLKQASANLDPLAALRSPVTVLLGVSGPAADLLRPLGVTTVFDLATLPIFVLAREIIEAANDKGSGAVARLDTVPGGYVADGDPPSLDALAGSPVTAMRGIDTALAQELTDTLQIETVGDLGRWLPFTYARQILEAATRQEGDIVDPAAELVPRMGEYPTERCFYTTMLIDHVEAAATEDLRTAGAIDIAPSVSADFGFSAPAVGARLSFAQSWFAHGVTLGNLLHSVALAPGESTRIAVVDWSRRTRSSATESITEAERLSQSTSHNRAVSEVQDAVATEAQSGFSHTESVSTTKQAGAGLGLSIGPVSFGASGSIGKTNTSADSFSSSFGARELSSSMSQKVMDSTQQAASSVRDRRASLIMEVSETEHESVSTRILANYNHMHALTVQYYEVIEIYRVTVELTQVERTLFVPMKMVDFDEATIRRYQLVLAGAALTRRARELLTAEFGTVKVSPVVPRRPWPSVIDILGTRPVVAARMVTDGGSGSPESPAPAPTPAPAPAPEPVVDRPPRGPAGTPALMAEFDSAEIARASRIALVDVVRPGSSDIYLPRDAAIAAVVLSLNEAMVPASAVTLKLASGEPPVQLTSNGFEWRAPRPVILQEISEIVLTTNPTAGTGAGRMQLQLSYHGSLFPVTLPIQVAPNTTATVCRMGDLDVGPELLEHLRANRLYYSQAIWRALDSSTIALLLSRFTFDGLPVADQVDPEPLMVAGNYVVLRMPAFTERKDAPPDRQPGAGPMANARAEWRKWLEERGLVFGPRATTEQLVPIPTGGVFAEAVLGRSNSAERLDATRFWNWQDSPIPLAPPEIAAINLASRAQSIDARPGQLGQPVLNIVNPTALPDPTGLGASLSAISNGGMFRDMSGLAATVGLAQAMGGTSAGAAKSAGELAQAALATAAQKEVALEQIKAQQTTAALANPNATTGSPKNVSEAGAAFNTARELDREKVASGGGDGGDGVTTSGPIRSSFGGSSSFTGAAFDRMVWGPNGASGLDLIRQPGGSGGGSGTAPEAVDELYFYSKAEKDEDYRGIAAEVQAIQNGMWRPTSIDFDAICERSGKSKTRADAKIADFMEFLEKLKEPARRFNFFIYGMLDSNGKPTITFDTTVNPDVGNGASRVIPEPNPDTPALDMQTLQLIREMLNTAAFKGMRELLQAIGAQNQAIPNRELWWYQVMDTAAEDLIQPIASHIGIPIFIFEKPIQFIPDFQPTPPKIHLRGQVGLGFDRADAMATRTKDIHTLDEKFLKVIHP